MLFLLKHLSSHLQFGCHWMQTHPLRVKGRMASIYDHLHNVYGPRQVQKSSFIYLWVWNLTLYIALRQGENENTLLLNNDDHNTTYCICIQGH